jgi:hypothetical protein
MYLDNNYEGSDGHPSRGVSFTLRKVFGWTEATHVGRMAMIIDAWAAQKVLSGCNWRYFPV